MITANASTAVDDLGVAASGNAAIERALDNDDSVVMAPRVISPTGIPGGAAEQPLNDLSRSLYNNDAWIIFQANTCAQSLKSLPLTPSILMFPPQMVQRFQISKYTRDQRSTGTSPHQVPQREKEYHSPLHPCTYCIE
jgi:hypothetical protein